MPCTEKPSPPKSVSTRVSRATVIVLVENLVEIKCDMENIKESSCVKERMDKDCDRMEAYASADRTLELLLRHCWIGVGSVTGSVSVE